VNAETLKSRFPNASPTFIRLNATESGEVDIQPDGAGSVAELERHPGNGAVGKVPIQKAVGRRFHVRVTAIRTRLLDWDNLCEKYHVDLLRYASGGVFGDGPATTTIEVCQQKAQGGEPEEVRLEVFEL
jgi:hypothetical protein